MASKIPANYIEFFGATNSKFDRWLKRLENAFAIYAVKEDKEKIEYLLHYLGAESYDILCDNVAPEEPEKMKYSDLITFLSNYYNPKPLEIAEYFKFHHRVQLEGETIREYESILRKMAITCNFGKFLETALRNQLVCGIRDRRITDRLLEHKDLTIQKAVEIANAMETSQSDSKGLLKTAEIKSVHSVFHQKHKNKSGSNSTTNPKDNRPSNRQSRGTTVNNTIKDIKCYRCDGPHYATNCRHKQSVCNTCKQTGHIQKVCKKQNVNAIESERIKQKLEMQEASIIEYVNNVESSVKVPNVGKIWIKVKINNLQVNMEFDSGAAVSLISYNEFLRKFNNACLKSSDIKLNTYCNSDLQIVGLAEVQVSLDSQSKMLKLYVVEGNKHALLGRDWIAAFGWGTFSRLLGSNSINSVESVQNCLDGLIKKYANLFDDETGKIAGEQVSFTLKPNSVPVFVRARPIPFALKSRVEEEIKNLVMQDILEKVDHSDYATPIVPVVKANGKIRICGDFKITINPQLVIDEHPLPSTNELFENLAGGEKFSKIDLKSAYLQWEVREEDRHLLTLSTHLGLFRSKRLFYGVNSAPAKWQRKIESILNGIEGVAVFIDDIRVTGQNDAVHLQRLEEVFGRLSEYGLKINLNKTEFLKDQIEYCGYVLNRLGIHKASSKIEAVKNAPRPTNRTELQSFLGLINYYHRFFQNLSEISEPLHVLLRKGNDWDWNVDCEKSFEKLKEIMQSDKFLIHYSDKLPVCLATDASPIGVGAVLSHIMPDGTEQPIQFASQTLNESQRRWAQIDKEAYSLVYGVKKFFQYLYGREFILYTDHKPLIHIFSPTKPLPHMSATRMQHYAIFLQGFNYKIKYKRSEENANADAFSRLPI